MGAIASIAVAAIAAGVVAGQQPAWPRPADQTVAVDDAWYDKLPMALYALNLP